MIDSTNPRVMADNIKKIAIAASAGTSVEANPEGEASGDLTSLGIDGVKYDIPTSADYSTDEVDTGVKWIDGKEIYCKVVELSKSDFTATNNWHYSYNVKTALSIDTLINVKGIYTLGSFGAGLIELPLFTANSTDVHAEFGAYYGSLVLRSLPYNNTDLKLGDQTAITVTAVCYYTKVTTP